MYILNKYFIVTANPGAGCGQSRESGSEGEITSCHAAFKQCFNNLKLINVKPIMDL